MTVPTDVQLLARGYTREQIAAWHAKVEASGARGGAPVEDGDGDAAGSDEN